MQTLKTIAEIKEAVDNGKKVFCDTTAYEVIKDQIGQYFIHCNINGYCIGLHGMEGTKYENQLNGTKFFVK